MAWTHLLPPEARLEVRGLPPELERTLGPWIGPAADTLVCWDTLPSRLGALERYRTVVLARPRGGSAAVLDASGFAHVRSFTVLPDLWRARWYLPLATRKVTARAWDLYSPSTPWGRATRLGAKLLTRSVGPLGLGDRLVMASRTWSALDAALAEAVGRRDFELAIGLPHAHGQRGRIWLLAIDRSGHDLAYAKFAYHQQSIGQLEREAAFTRQVTGLALRTAFVPRVLYAGRVGDGYLLVTTSLGKTSPSSTTLDARHLAVLTELGAHQAESTTGDLARLLGERCALLAGDLPAEWARRLARATEAVVSAEALRDTPTTLAHGDFVPWNMRRLPDDSRLALFDWEQGQECQFALWDAFNFLAQVDIVLRRIPAEQSVQAALKLVGASPLASELRLAPPQVLALYLAYLADSSARWFESHLRSTWQLEIPRTRTQPMKAAMLDAVLDHGGIAP
jgi:hypothetical protein